MEIRTIATGTDDSGIRYELAQAGSDQIILAYDGDTWYKCDIVDRNWITWTNTPNSDM